MPEVAQATITVTPVLEGAQQSLTDQLVGAGTSAGDQAGEEAGSSFSTGLARGIGTAAGVITGAMAAAGTALVGAANSTADYGDEIDKASQKLGVSSTFYQEWDAVLQHSGTSMDSMTATFKTLANASQDASEDQQAAFEALGLSMDEVANMSTEDLFTSVISGLQDMESGTERTALATDLLGRGAMEMGALLNTSSEDTQAMIDRVHELGGVMSDDAVAASADYKDSLQDMKTALGGAANGILIDLLPSLTDLMDKVSDFVANTDFTPVTEAFGGLVDSFSNFISGLDIEAIGNTISTVLSGIGDALTFLFDHMNIIIPVVGAVVAAMLTMSIISTITTVISGLSAAFTLMMGPVGLVVLAIAAVVAIGVALYQNWDTIKEKMGALKDAFVDKFNAVKDKVTNVINGIKDKVGEIKDAFEEKFNAVKDTVSNAFNAVKDTAQNVMNSAKDTIKEKLDNIKDAYEENGGGIKGVVSAGMEAVKGYYTSGYTFIDNLTGGKLSSIADTVRDKMDTAKQAVSDKLSSIKDGFSDKLSSAMDTVSDKFGSIKDAVSDKMNSAKTAVSDKLNSIKSSMSSKLGSAFTTVQSKFQSIKNAMTGPINSAKTTISNALDRIKNFFPLNIGRIFSNFQLPHISVDGGEAPFGIGGKGTKPSFSVSWYAKAMVNPYLFSDATLFGAGEAGDEILYGRQALLEDIREASSGAGTTINNYFTVNGAENPEDYANRLARQLQMQMRMV